MGFGVKKGLIAASTLAAVSAAGVLNAFAGPVLPPVVVKLPCDSPPWMACADMKKKLIDGTSDPNYPGGMKTMVREMLDDVYQNKVRLAKNLVSQPECTTFDNLNKPPLCPPLKIPEIGCVDESVNSFRVPTGTSPACPPISLVGAATNDHPL